MKKNLFGAALVCVVMFVSCGGNKDLVTKGSLSGKMDSLSYVLGANIGYGINYNMQDIPFNNDLLEKGITEGALLKSTQDSEESYNIIRDYFMSKRGLRAEALAQERAAADSVRMAAGDSTAVDYPVADLSMFISEGERDSVSYAFGNDIGFNTRQNRVPVQLAWMIKGMQDVRDGESKMTEDEVGAFLQNYFMVVRPAQMAEASQEWLASIEKKSGVKKTESGLLYKIVKAGSADTIAVDDRDMVSVHYKGTHRDGKVFDASRFADKDEFVQKMTKKYNPEGYDKDEPVEFSLNQVIKGWTEGMKLVGKGGTIQLWIPAELAYGERGSGRDIGPNEALMFEVDVLDVIPYQKPDSILDSMVQETTPELQ